MMSSTAMLAGVAGSCPALTPILVTEKNPSTPKANKKVTFKDFPDEEESSVLSGFPKMTTVTLVGEERVGKTSLVQRFQMKKFSQLYSPTLGLQHSQFEIESPSSTVVFRFLDTNDVILSPDSAFTLRELVASVHAMESDFVFIVYDITNHMSFEAAQDWLRVVKDSVNTQARFILVGNKADREAKREVHWTAGEVLSLLNDMMFFETSAKDGQNIEDLFDLLYTNASEKENPYSMDHVDCSYL